MESIYGVKLDKKGKNEAKSTVKYTTGIMGCKIQYISDCYCTIITNHHINSINNQ